MMSSKFHDLIKTDAIDMEHIDFDDVLQLYKVKYLQDSHIQFRGQIQALESVKELTVSLQAQVSQLQRQNNQLLNENKELSELNTQAEEILRDRVQKEAEQSKLLKENQSELDELRIKYNEITKSHKEVDILAADEQQSRLHLEKKLQIATNTIERMKDENRSLKQKYDSTSSKLSQCDDELAHASEQLSIYQKKFVSIRITNDKLAVSEAELSVLKGDTSRLIHLLEFYPPLEGFMKKWQDSEGMSFLGLGSTNQQDDMSRDQSAINHLNLLYSKIPSTGLSGLDDYNNRENGSDDGDDEDDQVNMNDKINMLNSYLTSTEFEHLKRVHNGDPFPIISIEDETSNWVPRKAAEIGMQFLTANLPHAPASVIMEFMRKMNKAWSKREARKIKRLKEVHERQIKDLKRKLHNSIPYRGVMADKQIRRLKAQVQDTRKKVLSGFPRNPEDLAPDYMDEDYFEFQDLDFLPPHHRRPCMIQKMPKGLNDQPGSAKSKIQKASAKKLLEASLSSLETLGRQMSRSGSMSNSYDGTTAFSSSESSYPSESYLRGALWLGKNISVILEDLMEAVEAYRSTHLTEIATASHDGDYRRSSHRLTLLAASGANEVISLISKARAQARDIIEGVAMVNPGDALQFQSLLTTLPIESTLGNTTKSTSPTRSSPFVKSKNKTPVRLSMGSTR